PVVACNDLQVTLDANGQASIITTEADGGSADNCTVDLSLSQTSFGYNDFPSTTVTLTATDPSGNSSSCELIVEVAVDCDNATDGGEIADTEISCGGFDPSPIQSLSPASGGSQAPIKYLWLTTNDPELPINEWMSVGTGEIFDPGFIDQTTYYIRHARRLGCDEYPVASNIIAKVVNGTGDECDADQQSVSLHGNASSVYANYGVQGAQNILGPIDGQVSRFYQNNDGIRVMLPDHLPAGSEVTISWKRRSNGGQAPARMLVYEDLSYGNYTLLNEVFFTKIRDFFVHSTITIAQEDVNSIWIVNASGYADFEVDAITYCGTDCVTDLIYCLPNGVYSDYEYVDRVKLNTVSNTSGDDGGYGDYTNLSTTLEQGTSHVIRLRPGFTGSSYVEYWRVWIDFDQNGIFDGYEKIYQGRGRHEKVEYVYVPIWAHTGETRMRVQMRYGGYGNPCSDGFDGEVEDYTINIDPYNPANINLMADDNITQNESAKDGLETEGLTVIADRSDARVIEKESKASSTRKIAAVDMAAWPNPSSGPMNVEVTGFEMGETFDLVLVNTLGQVLLSQTFDQGGDQHFVLDPQQLKMAPGTYILRARNREQTIIRTVVIKN
nr:T9SS type A sorting domain-containing protein [Saprospiraceae bacterium]